MPNRDPMRALVTAADLLGWLTSPHHNCVPAAVTLTDPETGQTVTGEFLGVNRAWPPGRAFYAVVRPAGASEPDYVYCEIREVGDAPGQ